MDIFTLLVLCGFITLCGAERAFQVPPGLRNKTMIPARMWQNLMRLKDPAQIVEAMLMPPETELTEEEDPNNVANILWPIPGSVEPDPSGALQVASELTPEAGCEPYKQPVRIPLYSDQPHDPNALFWPPCTPIEQCGGCCGLDFLECAPTEIQMVKVKVLTARYPYIGAQRFEFTGLAEILVPRHMQCECRCKVQPHHCDEEKQDYLPDSCRCRCRNEHLAATCLMNKLWNADLCECVCQTIHHCHEDEYFNMDTCRCEVHLDYGGSLPAPSVDPCEGHQCLQVGYEPRPLSTGGCRCRLVSIYPQDFKAVPLHNQVPNTTQSTTTTTTTQTPRYSGRTRNRRPRGLQAGRTAVQHRSAKDGHVPMIINNGKK